MVIYFFIIIFINKITENNHISDSKELAEFINKQMDTFGKCFLLFCQQLNILGINVIVTEDDTEDEATTIKAIKSNYAYTWETVAGVGYQRKYFCACEFCLKREWENCTHFLMVETWKQFTQKSVGNKLPKGLKKFASPAKAVGEEYFIVIKILGKRTLQV